MDGGCRREIFGTIVDRKAMRFYPDRFSTHARTLSRPSVPVERRLSLIGTARA